MFYMVYPIYWTEDLSQKRYIEQRIEKWKKTGIYLKSFSSPWVKSWTGCKTYHPLHFSLHQLRQIPSQILTAVPYLISIIVLPLCHQNHPSFIAPSQPGFHSQLFDFCEFSFSSMYSLWIICFYHWLVVIAFVICFWCFSLFFNISGVEVIIFSPFTHCP